MQHVPRTNTEEKLSLRRRWRQAQPTKTQLFWACVASIVLTMVVGFSWGGWVTGASAQKTAEALAKDAVIQRLAPICVAQFQQDPDRDLKLQELQATSTWERSAYVKDQAWTIMPGEEGADRSVTSECIKLLMLVSQ